MFLVLRTLLSSASGFPEQTAEHLLGIGNIKIHHSELKRKYRT